MTTQENVDRSLRLLLGDMHVQLILANAQIADLQEQVAMLTALAPPLVPKKPRDKPNGKVPHEETPPPV